MSNLTGLPRADSIHLAAAFGWHELGNHLEANEELERITPSLRAHPDVLFIRCVVYAALENWEAAFEISRKLVELDPSNQYAWLNQAQAVRSMPGGGVEQAWHSLLPVADKFPEDSEIPFLLACYAAQMGNITEAGLWLEQAFRASGHAKEIRLRALNEPDLEPLWQKIGKIQVSANQ